MRIEALADLDRRVLPRLADGLERLASPARGARLPVLELSAPARRVLGAIALVLLAAALALVLIGR